MIHVSGCCNPAMHTTGSYYLNADTMVFMQVILSDLFKNFPKLKFIIPHGGGAVPFHWGRFRGIALNNGKPELAEIMGKNIFFDTCVYHQPGIDLLTKVVPVDNILFASEMVGAVKGNDPRTGFGFDDTKRYVEAAPICRRRQDEDFRRQRLQGLFAAEGADRQAGGVSAASARFGCVRDTLTCRRCNSTTGGFHASGECRCGHGRRCPLLRRRHSSRPACAQVTAYEGARLIVGDGRVVENGTLVVDGARIVQAGAGVRVPAGATRVEPRRQDRDAGDHRHPRASERRPANG